MDEYKIYCTKSQICKALELGAPIEHSSIHYEGYNIIGYNEDYVSQMYAIIPTAEEMVGWLETQHVRAYAQPYTDDCDKKFKGKIHIISDITVKISKSRKVAILAAIDAALEYLEKNKNFE